MTIQHPCGALTRRQIELLAAKEGVMYVSYLGISVGDPGIVKCWLYKYTAFRLPNELRPFAWRYEPGVLVENGLSRVVVGKLDDVVIFVGGGPRHYAFDNYWLALGHARRMQARHEQE